MAKFEDLKGQKFGYWTVVERAENHSDNSSIPKTMHSGKSFLIYLFNAITGSGSVVSCAGYSRISNAISLHSTAFPSRM